LSIDLGRLEDGETEPMKMQLPPESCPQCGGTRLMPILWDYCFLVGEEKDAILAERAYLGLSHHYFTSVDPTLVVGRFIAKLSELPMWACLDCSPEWRQMHRLAAAEWQAGESKEAAVENHDFEKAAALLDQQCQLEAAHLPRYERLLRELIASKEAGPQRA
jgi:hypothetical protein